MDSRILRINNLRKTINYLKKNGIRHAFYAAKERIEEERKEDYYYKEPSKEALEAQRRESSQYSWRFSIVVPAYETKEEFLRGMIDSVQRQSYPKWELIIADASSSDNVRKVVEEITDQAKDCRIKYVPLAENKGISGNTNAGIILASGDYIALLDHDDFLAPDALYYMAAEVQHARQLGVMPTMIYTDEDKYENRCGYYICPHKKEKFNLDLILSNNYICHFMAVKTDVMKRLLLRGEYDGAQDYDLVLRVVGELYETIQACSHSRGLSEYITHIPRVLYHWRCHADSTAENTASKTYAYEAGRAALVDFCKKQGWRVQVNHSLHLGFYEADYQPDLLTVRADVGLVGGRILDSHNRICAGAMTADGDCLYEGLHKEYSGGSTHRAVLKQDVAAVDIRCMQVSTWMREVFEEITGIPYGERTICCGHGSRCRKIQVADISGLSCDESGYRKLSLELSKAAAERGYLVLWDPGITIRR